MSSESAERAYYASRQVSAIRKLGPKMASRTPQGSAPENMPIKLANGLEVKPIKGTAWSRVTNTKAIVARAAKKKAAQAAAVKKAAQTVVDKAEKAAKKAVEKPTAPPVPETPLVAAPAVAPTATIPPLPKVVDDVPPVPEADTKEQEEATAAGETVSTEKVEGGSDEVAASDLPPIEKLAGMSRKVLTDTFGDHAKLTDLDFKKATVQSLKETIVERLYN